MTKSPGIMPDVQFYRRDNPADRREEGCVSGPPDLVVEVISPEGHRYDRITKLLYYASALVPEYWIIDAEDGTLERLVLKDGRYLVDISLARDAIFRPPSFDGLEIPLAKLWPGDLLGLEPPPSSGEDLSG